MHTVNMLTCLRRYLHCYYCITVFIYVCMYFLIFLNSCLVYSLEDHIGNKCAIVCFNVSILGKYYTYTRIYIYIYYGYFIICLCIEYKFVIMFYQINSLTHNISQPVVVLLSIPNSS